MSGSLVNAQNCHITWCGPVHKTLPAASWKATYGPRPGLSVGSETRQGRPERRHVLQALRGAEDTDIAVFRFTLGIPGFNDALLPRVVGIFGAALLAANHLSDQGATTAAQVRTECLGAALSALCIATPSIGARLQAAQPGRGRTAGSADQSSGQVFQIAPNLPDDVKTDLAWASYSLLRNTNSSGVLVAVSKGNVQVVRGTVRQAAGAKTGQAVLDDVQEDLQRALDTPTSPLAEAMSTSSSPVYLPDAAALSRASVKGGLLPDSACSALVQPLRPLPQSASSAGDATSSRNRGNSQEEIISRETDSSGNGSVGDDSPRGKSPAAGMLMLWSDKPRALSQRERLWAAAVAAKLYDTLS